MSKKSKLLDKIIAQGEICAICLRPLAQRSSSTPHICVNCERVAKLSKKLDIVFGDNTRNKTATNHTLIRLCRIHVDGNFRTAKCPLCGARSQVRGTLSPTVYCRVCNVSLSQFNGKVIAHDTLLDRDLPYSTDEWRPAFDREQVYDAFNQSNSLDNFIKSKLEELNL